MSGESILIVDDNHVNLKLTRLLLVNEGYNVLTAESAEDALLLLREERPEVVLTDIQLPGMDGLEFTRRIKSDSNLCGIGVFAVTAYASPADKLKAGEAGCDGYITKPIDTRGLGAILRDFLNRGARETPMEDRGNPAEIAAAEMKALKARFLYEGLSEIQRLLDGLDGRFPAGEAKKAAHDWAGAAGLLGCAAIATAARELEGSLAERPLDGAEIREHLNTLALAFRKASDNPAGPECATECRC